MAAAAAIVRIGAGASAALNNVKATLQRVFPLGRSSESSTTSAFLENPFELPRRDFSQFVSHKGTDGDAHPPNLNEVSTGFEGENWEDGEEEQENGVSGKDRKSPDNGSVRGGLGAVQIACSGVAFGALVIAGLRYLPLHPRVAGHLVNSSSPPVSTTGVRKMEAVGEEVPKMDARLAEFMIRRWQAAKASALGSTHDMAPLPEVLEGEMLKSWTDRVSDVKRNGWFWEYTLLGLNIDNVTVSDDGRRATAEATLQEAARLVDRNNSEHNDSYRSTYTTRYDLRHGLDGWRISGGAVLRT